MVEFVVRASALNRVIKCAPSLIAPKFNYQSADPNTKLGTVFAEFISLHIKNPDENVFQKIKEVSSKHRIEPDELSLLAWNGVKCWTHLSKKFPSPLVEQEVSATFKNGVISLTLIGTIDLVSCDSGLARIIDWKFGSYHTNHYQQLMAYAACLMANNHYIDEVWLGTVDLLNVEIKPEGLHSRDFVLNEWLPQVMEKVIQQVTYTPGVHCGYCPRYVECQPRMEYFNSAFMQFLRLGEEKTWDDLDEVEILGIAKILEKQIAVVKDCIKAKIKRSTEQKLTTSLGTLRLKSETRREIITEIALPILTNVTGIPLEEITRHMNLTLTKLKEMVSKSAPRGQKTEVVEKTLKSLENEGALLTNVIEKFDIEHH